ncbi:MAG: hypothetical protein Q8R15_00145 [Candidatus Micrarchaeota archaeon]|nr:hypothetical protein [Candidatus Micrarchaeota archaeon]
MPEPLHKITVLRPKGSNRPDHELVRLVSRPGKYGRERLIIFPGVKKKQISGLFREKWKIDPVKPHTSGRAVFFAKTKGSDGKKFEIAVKHLRRYASYTHEARMLLHLRSNGIPAEQPLGLLIQPGERMLITRRIRGQYSNHFPAWARGLTHDAYIVEFERRTGKSTLEKLAELGIKSSDWKGFETVPSYLHGAIKQFVVDAEHLHSEKENKLAKTKQAKVIV